MIGFQDFFSALWSHAPFPWQSMLAERVSHGDWPKVLDLPTAAGKTACIEIALYALAAQADLPTAERTASRRIWFVVDRRIVVDEAFARAEHIALRLQEARDGPLREIADRLRQVSGTERPLAVARLRGGVFKDDGWARLPSQPAIITSTVDQFGSRLLFRSYAASQLTAPNFAGLAANDSLIVLDEAHCSVPFMQTLRAIGVMVNRVVMAQGQVSALRVHQALFENWAYVDDGLSMRWDPIDDRRYALMDRDPTASDNKSRTVWMANLLAYRALALFRPRLAPGNWA